MRISIRAIGEIAPNNRPDIFVQSYSMCAARTFLAKWAESIYTLLCNIKKNRMKGYKGLEFHSPKTDQWMIGIGKYLVNFGAVEFLTYALIGALTDDEALYESTKKKQLSERLTLINKLAKNTGLLMLLLTIIGLYILF